MVRIRVVEACGSENYPDCGLSYHRYLDTMSHMIKGCIGAGILALPAACSRLGIIFSVVVFLSVAGFASYSIQLLINTEYKLCKRWRRGYLSYPKAMQFALKDGPASLRFLAMPMKHTINFFIVVWQLGICTIYTVFVAENSIQILEYFKASYIPDLRLFCVMELLPLCLINLFRELKTLAPVSGISNIATTFGLLLIGFYLIDEDIKWSSDMLKLKDVIDIPLFIGTALFSLEAVGVILALEYNMENPKDFVGMCGLFNKGMVVICTAYMLVGIFGYLRFGDTVKSVITLSLPQNEKKAVVSRILITLAVFLSWPLQNIVAYKVVWSKIEKKVKNSRAMVDYAVRMGCVVLPWALAVAVPKLGAFIALFGALCLSLLAMVFPGLMSLAYVYATPEGYGPGKTLLVRDLLIVLIGTIILVAGVSASVLEIIKE